ncbi:hypothetical protein ACNOYE_33335 [Nannocystaceae bacterium ST9]
MVWQAPQDCPSATEFDRRVDEVRGDARLASRLEFVVEGEGPFELRVVGRRERYAADDCEALVDAALLLVSLALVPDEPDEPNSELGGDPVATRPREVDAGGEAGDVAPFLRGPSRGPDPRVTPVASSARALIEVGLTTGITPRPALDLFVGAGPRGNRWALDVGVIARPSFAGATLPDVGARLWSLGGLARVCVGGRAPRFALAGCAALDMSAVSARATGAVVEPRAATRAWAVVEVGPELTIPFVRRGALIVRVAGTWMAAQPHFVIADAGEVCCGRALGLTARVGVEFGLGR